MAVPGVYELACVPTSSVDSTGDELWTAEAELIGLDPREVRVSVMLCDHQVGGTEAVNPRGPAWASGSDVCWPASQVMTAPGRVWAFCGVNHDPSSGFAEQYATTAVVRVD